jgi:hypothetical protein
MWVTNLEEGEFEMLRMALVAAFAEFFHDLGVELRKIVRCA